MRDDLTSILSAIEDGQPQAADQLLPSVYDELRRLAEQRLAQEKAGQTLQATALVHEAYLRVAGGGKVQGWNSRGHFFAAAAEAMRRILVENARRKARLKRGGDRGRRELDEAALALAAPDGAPDDDLLALDAALTRLAALDPLRARLVQLRYFCGLSIDEAAEILGISPSTADRSWAYARAWLRLEIAGGAGSETASPSTAGTDPERSRPTPGRIPKKR
jgi:RNA polymerase sigma factor (TIGR02999 family)